MNDILEKNISIWNFEKNIFNKLLSNKITNILKLCNY